MKCVLYARVSSKEQETEGFSIPAQQKLLREYARTHKFGIVEEFTDVETAKSSGRIQFGKMVAYLKANSGVRSVLVEKTDRLYRNFKDYVTLEELDLSIHLVKENEIISKDSRSHAKFVHGIKVLLAKNYSDNLSEEVKKGMREKAEQGEYPAKAPLGYLNDKVARVVVRDPKYSVMVVRMFHLYATGNRSLKQVRDNLRDEGWRTLSGHVFSKSMVEMVLKNPFYFGEFLWNGARYIGSHEPLISRDLFSTVQDILTGGHGPRSRGLDFLFKGFLQCGTCGCAIVAEKKKAKYVYYHCTHARGACAQPWVKEEALDEQMASVFKAIEIDDNIISEIVRALKDGYKDEQAFRTVEVTRLKRRVDDLQIRLDKAYEDRLDGVIDERYWRDVSARWRIEQDQARDRLNGLAGAARNYVDEALEILELSKRAYSLYVTQTLVEKRKLLKVVLSNCTLNGVTLNPTYKKPFNLIAEGVNLQSKLPEPYGTENFRFGNKLVRHFRPQLGGDKSTLNSRTRECGPLLYETAHLPHHSKLKHYPHAIRYGHGDTSSQDTLCVAETAFDTRSLSLTDTPPGEKGGQQAVYPWPLQVSYLSKTIFFDSVKSPAFNR